MKLKINVIDAFAEATFKGNPAAVIITEQWLPRELMQAIAIENNLSETAFVKKIAQQHYEIRWFSPITEIDFCGHATLAASFVIFAQENSSIKEINFFAKAVGDLTVVEKSNGYIQMSFPNKLPEIVQDIPAALLNGLSITPAHVLLNNQAYFAVYEHENEVLNVEQNSELIKQLAPYDVVVTAPASEYDFISRYFWPANGGEEDPVTGSIHAGLAPYWAEKLNKHELVAYQASKRGGKLMCCVEGDKVYISGKAIQYLAGTIQV
ncbi:PhzF family phenazine biosynthesis protein [Cognaticolwellia beringensis]|uniref:PhzF family phenazine biosynthesis protein n=1 Tax=Cognaticolwellia beringensis TaxID=1967665 RepID=A0A222G8M9_9GAMM|nr:PhzF family phenazine biosynthesis protein [Cognaticolwellia beringensis]ASP48255.1 PhzF family phenazine biosynthesis protein [Cognaticolwellia beringensis]